MNERSVADLAHRAGLQVRWRDAAGRDRTVSAENLRRILTAMNLPCETDADLAESRARLAATARKAKAQAKDSSGRAFSIGDAANGRRVWGLGVQTYALRDHRGEAFGDFGAVARLAVAAGRHGAQAVAISPAHALFSADPTRYSPYAPSTRLFLNGLYADPSILFDDAWTPLGQASPASLIDWPGASREKLARLRRLHDRFAQEADTPRRSDFNSFVRDGGEDLTRHARFEALHGYFFGEKAVFDWRQWPQAYRDPASPTVAAFAAEHAGEVDFHLFLQWLADRSLAAAQAAAKSSGMSVGLIADLAVGMDPAGSHAWSRPDDLLKGLSVGAPPDIFQPTGQDWGIAAFSPEGLRRSGFEGYLSTLRAAMRHSGGVRIDHAMGLERLWVVPDGAGSADGAYLSYPFGELMQLLARESAANRAVVVAEDLGTVPEGFRETLSQAAMMGMRVLWFERSATTDAFLAPKRWDVSAAALTTTHDLPTLAGWWRGRDIEWALDLGRLKGDGSKERRSRSKDRNALWSTAERAGLVTGAAPAADEPEPAVRAGLGLVAATRCPLALVAVEDILALDEQPNLPGTIDEHPNWRRRLPVASENLFDDTAVAARVEILNRARPA